MTGGNGSEVSEVTMDDVKNLIRKKDQIEEQIKAYYNVLEDQGVGVAGPLVDQEGYPRADVNHYQIRTARHNLSCLQNDHKAIMAQIEEALHKLHAREKAKRDQDEEEAQMEVTEQQQFILPSPFAQVEAVSNGSPASAAGLRAGDGIILFGSVNTENFQNIQSLATIVQHNEGRSVLVVVVRAGCKVHINLTPQRWSGRGLLGCNIVPFQK